MRSFIRPLLVFLAIFASIVTAFACSGVDCKDPKNAANAGCIIGSAAVECTGGDVTGAIAKYGPTVRDIVQNGTKPDGSIDYGTIGGKLEQAVIDYGWCVVSDVFSHYVFNKKVAVGSGSGSSAPEPTPAAARDAFDQLRKKLAPGKSFKTAAGTL